MHTLATGEVASSVNNEAFVFAHCVFANFSRLIQFSGAFFARMSGF